MSSGSESWESRLFDLLAPILLWGGVIAGVCFVLYWTLYGIIFGILWIVPYLIFCALPCVALSFGLGILFAVLCRVDPSKNVEPDLFQMALDQQNRRTSDILSSPRVDYRRLAFLFPVAVGLSLGVVGLPEPHQHIQAPRSQVKMGEFGMFEILPAPNGLQGARRVRVEGKKWNQKDSLVDQPVLDWPWLYLAFNQLNSSWQNLAPILMGNKPYEPVVFDLNFMSCVVWLAVLLGMPLVFFWFSSRDVKLDAARLEAQAQIAVNKQEEMKDYAQLAFREKEAKWNETIAFWTSRFQQEEQKVKALTAKLEFAPPETPGLPVKISKKEILKKGVLDGDLL